MERAGIFVTMGGLWPSSDVANYLLFWGGEGDNAKGTRYFLYYSTGKKEMLNYCPAKINSDYGLWVNKLYFLVLQQLTWVR